MGIGVSGISTGADWNNIISQLMNIESQRLTTLKSRESTIEKQISDYGLVKSSIDNYMSSLSGLQDGSALAVFAASSTDASVVTASADSTASVSSYDIVVSQLASRDKIASSAYTDSATTVGTGTLSVTVNGQTMNLTVDASNNTLSGLADAINSASDNPGVTASILNETGGSRLILTSNDTGTTNAVTINVTDSDGNNTDASGLSKLFYIGVGGDGLAEQISTAQNALLTIDGFNIESASNAVTGAITGVTLNLTAAGSATIDLQRDNTEIESRISAFVDAYNTLMDQFDQFQSGSLANNSGLRRMEQGFKDILNEPASISGTSRYLFEIGITRDKYGKLSLDSGELSTALANDFSMVTNLFSDSTTGFATRLYNFADDLLSAGGIIESTGDGLEDRKRTMQDTIDREQERLSIVEKSLVKQFASLDKTVSLLQSTSSYLASQLSSLTSG